VLVMNSMSDMLDDYLLLKLDFKLKFKLTHKPYHESHVKADLRLASLKRISFYYCCILIMF